jgi:hypothetical protein
VPSTLLLLPLPPLLLLLLLHPSRRHRFAETREVANCL